MKKSVFLLGTVSVLAAVQFFAPVVSAAVGSWSTSGNDMYYKDGKIGIGTMFPKGSLAISDNGNINGNFANRVAPFAVGDVNGTGKAILIDGNQIEQADNSDLYINHNSTAKLILNQAGGNVGVGTSNTPSRLSVNGDVRLMSPNNSVIFHGGGEKIVGTPEWGIQFQTQNSTPRMTIANNGNVGIGTSGPSAKLDVVGAVKWNNSMLSTDQGGAIELGGNNSVAGTGMPFVDFHHAGKTEDYSVRMINHAPRGLSLSIPSTNEKVDGVSIDVASFGSMQNLNQSTFFKVTDQGAAPGNKVPFIIKGNGNVGIGNENPQHKLTVKGSVCLGNC